METFSLLIKPASADCNLNCEYCFYLKKKLYADAPSHRMTHKQLEMVVKKYMKIDQPFYTFVWQGGEPTIMGMEFYERAVTLQKKYRPSGRQIFNAIQTNGFALTDNFINHLSENHYLVGLSLDGPQEIHDIFRMTAKGRGSHARVYSTWKKLLLAGVEANTVTLVSSSNVGHASTIYNYFKDIGSCFHQYIPCVEFDHEGNLLPFSITALEWGTFLCELFDVWYADDVGRISIRYFEALIDKMVTGRNNLCQLGNNCRPYLVVENNCDIYPCDFFVEKKLKLGNLKANSFESIRHSEKYTAFGRSKQDIAPLCRGCRYFKLCTGDCMKNRVQANNNLSHLCDGYKQFFDHAIDRLKLLTVKTTQGSKYYQLNER